MNGGLSFEKDLFGLQSCYRDLLEMQQRASTDPDDKAVRYAVIKTFELTWEMAVNTLTSYMERTSVQVAKVEEGPYANVIRMGERAGVIKSGWPEWKKFRELRGRTVHTYGDVMALAAEAQLQAFVVEVGSMLSEIERRISEDG